MANSDIHSTFFLGATAHLTNKAIIKITWKNDEPIWTEQWPLMKDKLQATKELIDTQLEWKHIEESYSPWNSIVIRMKSNKWHRLTDLRKVNASMKPMGALQPGQDCFFNIPLHPLDREKFSLSLSLILIIWDLINGTNRLDCHKRWWILPPCVSAT